MYVVLAKTSLFGLFGLLQAGFPFGLASSSLAEQLGFLEHLLWVDGLFNEFPVPQLLFCLIFLLC